MLLPLENMSLSFVLAILNMWLRTGLCLALATDIRIAYANAKLGVNFTQLNLSPGMGGTFFLPRVAGPQVRLVFLFFLRLFICFIVPLLLCWFFSPWKRTLIVIMISDSL